MDARRRGAARRMVAVMGYSARSANAHSPVAAQVDQGERFGAAYRRHQPSLGLDPRKLAPPPAHEAVASQGLPECAANRLRRTQHDVAFLRVAEPARRRRPCQKTSPSRRKTPPTDRRCLCPADNRTAHELHALFCGAFAFPLRNGPWHGQEQALRSALLSRGRSAPKGWRLDARTCAVCSSVCSR